MTIQGIRHTDNFASNVRPTNFREGILLNYPNGMAPLTGLTSGLKTYVTDDPKFTHFEKDFYTRRIALTGNLTDSQTTITVASGALALLARDVLWVEKTDELLYVNVNPTSDTSINVTRGWAGSTATAITFSGSNPYMLKISTAFEQGSDAPMGRNFDPSDIYNYVQIFRNATEATGTALATKTRTGDELKEARREGAEQHAVDIEYAFWLGKRYYGSQNGKPLYTTGGIKSWIPSDNIYDIDGTVLGVDNNGLLEMQEFEKLMEIMFRNGSSEKMGWCGNLFLLAVNQMVRKNSTWNIQNGLKEYGMRVSRLMTPFGEIVLKTHPLFNMNPSATDYSWYGMNSWCFVLDMADLTYVPMKGRDTKFENDLEENGKDGKKSGWLTEAGLRVAHANRHFLIKNVKGGKVDD